MNCILLHGMSSYLENGIGHGIIKRAKKIRLKHYPSSFPIKRKKLLLRIGKKRQEATKNIFQTLL